jgi:hypothetical protein
MWEKIIFSHYLVWPSSDCLQHVGCQQVPFHGHGMPDLCLVHDACSRTQNSDCGNHNAGGHEQYDKKTWRRQLDRSKAALTIHEGMYLHKTYEGVLFS